MADSPWQLLSQCISGQNPRTARSCHLFLGFSPGLKPERVRQKFQILIFTDVGPKVS